MIQIVGTVRSTVNLARLDSQWQQKKNNLGRKDKNRELTPQERQIQRYQEELAQMREDNETAAIYNKLKSGSKLTPEEIAYLRKNNPQALKEYEELLLEREAYRRQLHSCKSKEEVEQLKINKMNGFLSQAKSISSNPNIPKGEKLAQLEKLMRRLAGVREEHIEFTKTVRYQELPEKEEVEKGAEAQVPEKSDSEKMENPEQPNQETVEAENQKQGTVEVEGSEQETSEAGNQEKAKAPDLEGTVNEIRRLIQSVDETKKQTCMDVSV